MDDKQFSSYLSIRYLRLNQEKYAQATISRNLEWNNIEASEDLLRTLFTGSIWPEHKTQDNNSGKHGRTPLLYTVLYHIMLLQGDFSKWRTSFIRETRDASTSTKGCTQMFLANTTTAAAAGHFWECINSQLDTVCRSLGRKK